MAYLWPCSPEQLHISETAKQIAEWIHTADTEAHSHTAIEQQDYAECINKQLTKKQQLMGTVHFRNSTMDHKHKTIRSNK